MNKPIQTADGEWWYKGCYIQKQNHPKLLPFYVFKDTIEQETVGTCITFQEAKALALRADVKNSINSYKNAG